MSWERLITRDYIARDVYERMAKGFKAMHQQELNETSYLALIKLCIEVDMDPLIYTYEELYPHIMAALRRYNNVPRIA